jgi:hypothetical protein
MLEHVTTKVFLRKDFSVYKNTSKNAVGVLFPVIMK